MKYLFVLAALTTIPLIPLKSQVKDFQSYPVYQGKDLGLTYSSDNSLFRIWSPPADNAQLMIFANGADSVAVQIVQMKKDVAGTWKAVLPGDHAGKFYAFRVHINNQWLNVVPDPYAKAVGVNGRKAMVVDMKKTNPEGWSKDLSPVFHAKTDAIIYELHVRDASIAANSGIEAKGKFIGLTEKGTKNPGGLSTGLDHLKELGVTHIHLLPSYDFYSVDESRPDKPQYNWGYDPLNYNTPEGSYATNAEDGITRIKEFKQLIKTFHENGLRVVMDVVYNHTMLTENSYFNQLVPGYYYRQTADGKFSNATACGNETASERPMMRKFILESMKYWVEEYHVDGFRVDLMGVHDIETMNLVSKELHKIRPDILLYGEGWTAGSCPLPDSLRALKANAYKLDNIAVFSDDIRDGIKGSVFDHHDKGFASGKSGMKQTIKFGVVASISHPQVDYSKVNYSKAPYAAQPYHTVSYAECHDNHVLWDKLAISAASSSEEERRNMHKLAVSIVLTSQGISFLHAGTEFLRTKQGVENSYNSPDSINLMDWDLKSKNKDVFDYVRGLIAMRKAHPAFRIRTADKIRRHLRFVNHGDDNLLGFTIDGAAVGDKWKKVHVIYNGSAEQRNWKLPQGIWSIFSSNNTLKEKGQRAWTSIKLQPYSCTILYQ